LWPHLAHQRPPAAPGVGGGAERRPGREPGRGAHRHGGGRCGVRVRPGRVCAVERTLLPDAAWLGVPVRHPSTRELMGVLIAGGEELTPLLTVEPLGRMAARLEQLLAHEELVRRVALLDTYQRFLLDHPQDAVLALDGRGQVWGVSPAVAQ